MLAALGGIEKALEDKKTPSKMSDSGDRQGRVRKKSAKVLEMEEFEEAEKKQFTKKGAVDASKAVKPPTAPTVSTVPPAPSTPSPTAPPPAKKQKVKIEKVEVSPVAKPLPVTPPQTKSSPQAAKTGQTPSSVIKFLLSSPAIPTTPSVSTKAVTKTSPNSELSPGQVSPNVKKTLKAKVKLEPGGILLEDDEEDMILSEPVPEPIKQEVEIKPKLLLTPKPQISTAIPIVTPPTASSKPIDAAGSMDSLKMKLLLSPRDKKPKASFEQMLESGNQATALALAKSVKKKKKKTVDASAVPKEPATPKPVAPAESPSASEAMPNLAALVTSGKKKHSIKKKIKPAPTPGPSTPSMDPTLAAAFNSSKLSDSPIDVEYEPNLVIADDGDKVKSKKKLTGSGSKAKKKHGQETGNEGSNPAPPEGDIAALAAKVKVGDKKSGKKKEKEKEKEESDLLSKKRKRPPTAYTLYCNAHRAKLVAENPGIDFAQISRRLGEMWQTLTKKEKWCWKRKAKKMAGKGSTLISTGKGNKPKPAVSTPPAPATPTAPTLPVAKPMVPHQGARIAKASGEESALSPIKGFGTEPVDVAAHLKLLGESLSIIGMRLQEHKGLIAVQGSMSVLLDSLLCSFGPLMCLTQQVPEINGCSRPTHGKTLDNIAYVMPGL
ncbi:HMG domain-containing protein 4-like isoform X1 [Haliotis rufescens]|uniref:HMG domain-containing protein 4-like isoform X1 n=1 Tax=Haliotis rufescens TaxID=6454 RepID=UPI00201F8877|nr:HMG domain-containing protein 4-like isoform X1 [Haliotis rufescens]